jgi:20S proteasome alpha/beta subunit
MTVCIAAICSDGKSVVVCADRMFTFPGLSVEFETLERKIEQIGSRCIAMSAGNSANAMEVIDRVRRKLGGNPNPAVQELAEIFREEYATVRNKMAQEHVIMPMLGADFDRFRLHGVPLATYLEKQPGAFQNITVMCSQQNLGADLLIAGIDSTGAHLFLVGHPGACGQLDKLGYAATGSGGIHATIRLSLGGQNRSRDLMETLAEVYSAKRAAEVAPGVGEATDVAIIDSEIRFCSKPVMDELKFAHESVSAKPKLNLDSLRKKYDEEYPSK